MPPPLPPGREVELPGRGTTFIRETGRAEGPTLILLHGLSASADLNWFRCFGPLARDYRVIALDQRGHGRGIRMRGRWFRLEDCADDAAAVADVLGIDRFIPVGYSMGGPVAMLTAHRHRDRVDGMVLCATSGSFGSSRPESRLAFGALAGMSVAARLTPLAVRRQLTGALLRGRQQDGEFVRWARAELLRNDAAAILQAAVALGNFRSRSWLPELNLPTAVVITTRDRLVPPVRQQRLADAISGAVAFPIAGDHGACVAEPGLFVPALLAACASVTARAPRVSH